MSLDKVEMKYRKKEEAWRIRQIVGKCLLGAARILIRDGRKGLTNFNFTVGMKYQDTFPTYIKVLLKFFGFAIKENKNYAKEFFGFKDPKIRGYYVYFTK